MYRGFISEIGTVVSAAPHALEQLVRDSARCEGRAQVLRRLDLDLLAGPPGHRAILRRVYSRAVQIHGAAATARRPLARRGAIRCDSGAMR